MAILDLKKSNQHIGGPNWSDLSPTCLTALLKSWNSLTTYAYVQNALSDPIENADRQYDRQLQRTSMEYAKISTTARSAADHQCATTRTNFPNPPPPKIKWNRRFNALANEVQNTFDTKHKKRPTHYKDTMRPQQAIRSNTEHICTTMFIRRRILRFLTFVTAIWQPHTDSIPGCFIRPQTHIHTWKLEWSNYVNTSAHSAAG